MLRKLLGAQMWIALAALVIAAVACAPPGVGRAMSPALSEPPPATAYRREAALSAVVIADGCSLAPELAAPEARPAAALASAGLRGDPSFDPNELSASARCWYEELWSLIADPGRSRQFTNWAASNDLYTYSRDLNTHVNALLLAFRVTGDLLLLDEVERLAQHMRTALADTWHGAASLDRGSVDGYLNWVWRVAPDPDHYGRDLHINDEMRTHALVAQIAWALRNNADLESPNGVDYGERAEFWLTYLREHFEAKWRERERVPWPRMPFVYRPHMHAMVDFVRYHHYMHLLTGEDAYRGEFERLSGVVLDNMRVASAPTGPALVTPRSILAMGGSEGYLMPSTYARYVFATAVDMYFEGAGRWSDADLLGQLARALSEFMLDDGDAVLARDVGGGVERAGIPASDADDWDRVLPYQFGNSPFAFLSAWERGDRIAAAALEVYSGLSRSDRGVFIPVAMLVDIAVAAE